MLSPGDSALADALSPPSPSKLPDVVAPIPSNSPNPPNPVSSPRQRNKDTPAFRFTDLGEQAVKINSDKEARELFAKWGLAENMCFRRLVFDQTFHEYDAPRFLRDLLNESSVKVMGPGDAWCSLGRVDAVEFECVSATLTDMLVFQKLYDNNIVRTDGSIRGCLDAYHSSGLVLSDLLRVSLLDETSDDYEAFTPEDRREMLFKAVTHLALGGKLCQYEDDVGEYLGVGKKVYRELVSVAKSPSGALTVPTLCYSLTSCTSSLAPLFPAQHPQNFCYACVEPARKTVVVWYHASGRYY